MRTRTLAVAGLLLVSSGAIGFASIEAQSSDPPPNSPTERHRTGYAGPIT